MFNRFDPNEDSKTCFHKNIQAQKNICLDIDECVLNRKKTKPFTSEAEMLEKGATFFYRHK